MGPLLGYRVGGVSQRVVRVVFKCNAASWVPLCVFLRGHKGHRGHKGRNGIGKGLEWDRKGVGMGSERGRKRVGMGSEGDRKGDGMGSERGRKGVEKRSERVQKMSYERDCRSRSSSWWDCLLCAGNEIIFRIRFNNTFAIPLRANALNFKCWPFLNFTIRISANTH